MGQKIFYEGLDKKLKTFVTSQLFLKCNNFQGTINMFTSGLNQKNRITINIIQRDHSFSTYAIFSEKLNIYPLKRTCTYAYQGVRNGRFSENFAYLLNE